MTVHTDLAARRLSQEVLDLGTLTRSTLTQETS